MGSHRRTIAAAVATILASVSLYPIFIGVQWFWAGVGSVLVVALAGTLTRLRRLPVAVCLAGGLVALVLYLNLGFENAASRYHLIPTPNSLRLLWDLAGQGFNQSAKYAPPVPELSGMVLLAAGGIGLTALLTDLIAVRLENAAMAGLPLLLLFTEPFTLNVSRGWLGTIIAFCLGTVGYLALLSSEGKDRIREWERPNPGPTEIPDTTALATTGRRVGIASVAVALCLPLVIPGLHTTRLFGGQPGIGGAPGPGGVGFPDPNAQLSNELRQGKPTTVLTYASSDANPQYFQIFVLDNLTASGWQLFSQPRQLVSASARVPAAPGLTDNEGAVPETTNVTISQGVGQDELGALPLPYPAVVVRAPGNLQADKNSLMVFDSGVTLAGLRYTVTSLDQSPRQQTLDQVPAPPSDITNHYLEVPATYAPLLRFAQQIASQAKAQTPFQKAVAIQNYLSSGSYKYTLTAPSINSAQGVENFLLNTKKGYCQQFSFSMAVLARLLGIPSRVAYGFTAGRPTAHGTWVVTTHDAHAWPELYFQGFGWLRFEPTPGGVAGQGTASTPTYTQQAINGSQNSPSSATSGGTGGTSSSSQPIGPSAALRHELNLAFGAGAPGEITTSGTSATPTALEVLELALLALLGLLVLVAAAPACARLLVRRRRWRSGARGGDAGLAHAAWQELRDDLVDYRAGYLPSESPRALTARVGAALELTGPSMGSLRRIAMAEERARYAARPDSGAGLREDSATVRRAIAAAAPRRTRWLARLVPASVLGPAMIRLAQAVDFSGRLNTDWFGRSRLRGARLGRAGAGHAESRVADEEAARRTEPPVGAGAGRR